MVQLSHALKIKSAKTYTAPTVPRENMVSSGSRSGFRPLEKFFEIAEAAFYIHATLAKSKAVRHIRTYLSSRYLPRKIKLLKGGAIITVNGGAYVF